MASSVYIYSITNTEVSNALGMTIDSTSRPNATHITARTMQLCADVNVELEALGLVPEDLTSSNDANLYHKVRGFILDEMVGEVHAHNQRDDSEFSQAKRDRWVDFKDDLRNAASRSLGQSAPVQTQSSVTASSLRSVDRRFNKDWSFK